jgi:hypothetical protein
MVVHACNSSTQEAGTGGLQIKASLDYILGLYLNKMATTQRRDI